MHSERNPNGGDPKSDFLCFNHAKILQREDNGLGFKKKAPSF